MEKAVVFPQRSIVTKILDFGRKKKDLCQAFQSRYQPWENEEISAPPKDGRLFKGETLLVTFLLS